LPFLAFYPVKLCEIIKKAGDLIIKDLRCLKARLFCAGCNYRRLLTICLWSFRVWICIRYRTFRTIAYLNFFIGLNLKLNTAVT
jgi:hypothetical protein